MPLRDRIRDDETEPNGTLKDDDVEKRQEWRGEGDLAPPVHASITDRIAHFTWPWFACTMSTGALAVVIAQTPNRFPGLTTIGKIFFLLDLVLFILFACVMATRFILVPRKLFASIHHPVEGLFFGAFWVSVSLILNCMQSYGVPNTGPWLVAALRVLFWIYCATVLLVAVFQYFVLFQEERLNVADAMPAWIFPIYPLLVVGPMAGTMIPSQEPSHAYPMWVGALMLQGVAWTVAIMMYSIYTQRLMGSSLPTPPTRPGMFVSVGPAGYTAAGLISLGTQAPNVMPTNAFNISSSFADGEVVKILGVLSGTFVLLFAFWFFCISTVSVLAGVRRMTFTLNWWAFVFPNAGLTLACIQLAEAFGSDGINGFCSFLTVMLVVLWIMTAVAHIRAVWQGTIMWPGKDEDKDMEGIKWGSSRSRS